jgi:PII-like signaling protein
MECDSKAAALEFERTAVAGASALQGAFGTGKKVTIHAYEKVL